MRGEGYPSAWTGYSASVPCGRFVIGRFPTHKISHPKRVEKSQQETTWAIEDSKVEKFEGQNIEINFLLDK